MADRTRKKRKARQRIKAIDWKALRERERILKKGLTDREKQTVLELVRAGLTWADIVKHAGSEEVLDKVTGSLAHDPNFHAALQKAILSARDARKIRLESRIYGVDEVDDSSSLVQRHKMLLKLEHETINNSDDGIGKLGKGIGQGIAAALLEARRRQAIDAEPSASARDNSDYDKAQDDVIDVPLV